MFYATILLGRPDIRELAHNSVFVTQPREATGEVGPIAATYDFDITLGSGVG